MEPYIIRQRDRQGDVVSEQHVEATSNDYALRQIEKVAAGVERLEVYDRDGKKVREIGVAYWRRRTGRRR